MSTETKETPDHDLGKNPPNNNITNQRTLWERLNNWVSHDNYFRFLRFGLIDSSLLVIGALSGFSLDSVIAARIGVRGYGTIIGAGIGNIAADGIAALPEGSHAAIGVVCGTTLPLVPICYLLARRRELTRRANIGIGVIAGLIVISTFLGSYINSYVTSHQKS